jgi:hypothetical protein
MSSRLCLQRPAFQLARTPRKRDRKKLEQATTNPPQTAYLHDGQIGEKQQRSLSSRE